MSKYLYFILALFISIHSYAQINPYETIEKERSIKTLSNGEFLELENNDSLQQIGTVIVNNYTGRIHAMLKIDTVYSESTLEPTIISRWYSPDPIVKHNESPYAAMSNNPIWFGDADGRDTLMMHRKLLPEYNKYDSQVQIYKVTFSIIRNGVEEKLDQTMYMMANAEFSKKGYNALPEAYYKLTWDQLTDHSGEEGWENTIRVFKGVFIHPGKGPSHFGGCVGVTAQLPHKENTSPDGKTGWVTISNTSKALGLIRKMYDDANGTENNLTGDKFVLKNNSVAKSSPPPPVTSPAPVTPVENEEITPLEPRKITNLSGGENTIQEPIRQ